MGCITDCKPCRQWFTNTYFDPKPIIPNINSTEHTDFNNWQHFSQLTLSQKPLIQAQQIEAVHVMTNKLRQVNTIVIYYLKTISINGIDDVQQVKLNLKANLLLDLSKIRKEDVISVIIVWEKSLLVTFVNSYQLFF